MARLAKGMDPLGDISSEDDEAEGSGSEPERDPEPVKKKPTVDYATLSQHGYKRCDCSIMCEKVYPDRVYLLST